MLLQGRACVHVNRAALIASTAALACDWRQTRGYAEQGWRDGARETNPMLGRTPSTSAVDLYFAGAAAVNIVLWSVLPQRWSITAPTTVLAVQANAVYRNINNGTGSVCAL